MRSSPALTLSPAPNELPATTPIPRSGNPAPTNATSEVASTRSVVDRHLKSFFDGDLEGLLSDYAPGALFFTQNGPLRGTDEIRPLFASMIAEFAKPGAAFNLRQTYVEAGYAYILWTAETADHVYELGTDTFIVQNGRIVAQSFTGKVTARA